MITEIIISDVSVSDECKKKGFEFLNYLSPNSIANFAIVYEFNCCLVMTFLSIAAVPEERGESRGLPVARHATTAGTELSLSHTREFCGRARVLDNW